MMMTYLYFFSKRKFVSLQCRGERTVRKHRINIMDLEEFLEGVLQQPMREEILQICEGRPMSSLIM